jgi:hypothetical protein
LFRDDKILERHPNPAEQHDAQEPVQTIVFIFGLFAPEANVFFRNLIYTSNHVNLIFRLPDSVYTS